ncbi:MAG TPA: pyruvate kinase [Chloroflexota bacterium]|nr:pyruvate kinase [Chloroflexota bacterium]
MLTPTITPWMSDPLIRRRTKIVATLGPASSEPDVIARLINAGVNVFRLNFSHGDHATHGQVYERVRAASTAAGEPVAILADLCGPKIRVGRFEEGSIRLESGSHVVVTTRAVTGVAGLIPSQYVEFAHDVRQGDRVLLDDGLLELRVEAIDGSEVACRVINGGVLKDHKGMNLPGVQVSAPAFTEKDHDDAVFALGLGVDFIALSFVRRALDFDALKGLIADASYTPHVIAKIEKPEALEAIDEILEACDGIMVARGDLGVELPPEIVPIAQRRLIARARAFGKPAIVATQMLESMVFNPRPTRAEVSDISTAVFDGADAIMLSAESASGAHPVAAVEMMDRIARQVEGYLWTEKAFDATAFQHDVSSTSMPLPLHQAIARSLAQLSRDLRVRCIIVLSSSGITAMAVAAGRPAAPVVVVSPDSSACRRANLLWGTVPIQGDGNDLQDPHALARRLAVDLGFASAGHYILAVTGFKSTADETSPTITTLRVF